jgi:serine/threonine protein kinase
MIGKTVAHYKITEQLGKGGMGEVYLSDDTTLDRKVALKFLPEVFTNDPERMARFEREAKLLASLNHPNIAGIYGLEQADGNRFLVLEYVEGETLQARLRKGALSLDDALAICRQITEGLEAAHEKGVIHRDLKPANVMITAEEKVKILDFGLAKAFADETQTVDPADSPTITAAMTQPGVVLGTAAYMSPEQAKGKSVDKRADIWAFGCILYECLTGKRAFEGETVTETLAAIIRGEPDWNALPVNTPQNIRFVLRRCLEKERRKRFRDIADVQIEIEAFRDFHEAAAIPARHSRLPWSVTIAVGLIALVLAFLHFRGVKMESAEETILQIVFPENLSPTTEGSFALSPDGRNMAFSAVDTEGLRIWIRGFDSLEARLLKGTDSAQCPPFCWSPDSRFIAFNADGKLKKVDVSGSPPEIICNLSGEAVGGAWNSEDIIIFGDYRGSNGIVQVAAEGGSPTPVTRPNPERKEQLHYFPSFLPDGRHFLYFCKSSIPEYKGVYIGSLDLKPEEQDTEPLMITSTAARYVPGVESTIGYLLYLNGQALMAQPFDNGKMKQVGRPVQIGDRVGIFEAHGFFSASETGVLAYRGDTSPASQPTWVDAEGKFLETVGAPDIYYRLAISADGRNVAAGKFAVDKPGNSFVWLYDLKRNVSNSLASPQSNISRPVWSADGRKIIFMSKRGGPSYDLYRRSANGSAEAELLFESVEDKYPTSCSSDGRFVLYTAFDENDNSDLCVLSLESDNRETRLLPNEFNESDGHFSPDMHWIAYVSDQSGVNEIYVREFLHSSGSVSPVGAGGKVSEGGGLGPRWRHEGTELYYCTEDGKVLAVSFSTGTVLKLGEPRILFEGIPYYLTPSSQARFPVWDVHPDGGKFLLLKTSPGFSPAPFNIIQNWTSLLER